MGPEVFTQVINSYLPEPHASLVNGILFGINLKTSKEFYLQLKKSGLLHIVVLSGMNITLLASVVGNLTSFFSKKISILITILIIIFFVIFVGPKAPIVRAAFMGVLTLVAILLGRKSYSLYSLFLSLIFIGIFFPKWIKSVSLHLSYAATLGIILFGSQKQKNKKKPTFFDRILDLLLKEIKPSLAAQVFTAPIVLFYFKEISLIAPISNLLIAPIIAPLMITSTIASVFGKLNYHLGLIPAWFAYIFSSYIVIIVEILSSLSFSFVDFL